MILGSKISCWGFPLPQLSGPRATQRCPRYHSPFPALKILRDNNLLKTEHWIFSPHPRQSEPYPPTAPKRLPHAPSPSNLKEMDLPLPFPGLPSHPGPQNRPLTNCLGNWEGLQLVLPIRLGEGAGRRGHGAVRTLGSSTKDPGTFHGMLANGQTSGLTPRPTQ